MKLIIFRIHICGMSMKTFSKKIMIDKPFKTITKVYTIKDCIERGIVTIDDLVTCIKESDNNLHEHLGSFGIDHFNFENVYLRHHGYLVGFQQSKKILDVWNYFKKRFCLELDYICVVGGASRAHHGYKFIVHPREEIHKNTPHVHVEKYNVAPRYYLNTFTRFAEDEHLTEHTRDEKKIIKPYLKKHQKWFYEKWHMYLNGYIPPAEDEHGKQYCKES